MSDNQQVKQRQYRNLSLIGIIVLVVVLVLLWLFSSSDTPSTVVGKNAEHIPFTSSLDHVDENRYWRDKIQLDLANATRREEQLAEKIDTLQKTTVSTHDQREAQSSHVAQLQAKLAAVESQLRQSKGRAQPLQATPSVTIYDNALPLTPKANTTKKPAKTPENYVPANTFVKAIILEGADAAASTLSQANPTPMLFRLVSNGTLPNKAHSHLKGCFISGAVIGDISSERGKIRLERLSCVKPDSAIVDIPVKGTVVGPSGKDGVRGIPVWREGALLQRALVAGTLGGLSSALSQQYTESSVSALGSTQTVNGKAVLQYGLAKGASNAMDKLAEYNIKRADQYHPVIQLSAGTVVDIVFLSGFYVDEQDHQNTSEQLSRSVRQAGQALRPPKDLLARAHL